MKKLPLILALCSTIFFGFAWYIKNYEKCQERDRLRLLYKHIDADRDGYMSQEELITFEKYYNETLLP